jgi:hypothetical protein
MKLGVEIRCADSVEHTLQEGEVHATDQLGLLFSEGVEGTVVQGDAATNHLRLVSVGVEHLHHDVDHFLGAWFAVGRADGFDAASAAGIAGYEMQGVGQGRVGPLGLPNGTDQEPTGQVVAALGQAGLEVDLCPPVELGRTAGAGAAPARGPAVLSLEQAVVHQAVEVELGDVVGNAEPGGGLLAAHWVGLGSNEAIEGAPSRITEGGEAVETDVEVRVQRFLAISGGILSYTRLDEIRKDSNISHIVR